MIDVSVKTTIIFSARAAIGCALFYGLVACASYTQETEEIRSRYRAGRYEDARKAIGESVLKEQQRNRLLYLLEMAMIDDRLGENKRARQLLLDADRVVDQLYTTSVSETAASFVYNDSAMAYPGEDYEKVAIHTMLAISFLGDKDLAAAGVEARKINNRLNEINQAYDERKNRYGEDAFARYLSAMIHEAQREWDSAIIDYQKALTTYQSLYTQQFDTSAPDAIIEALLRLLPQRDRKDQAERLAKQFPKEAKRVEAQRKEFSNTGELIVIHDVGTITPKHAEEFVWPIGKQIVRFSFPAIRYRGSYEPPPSGVDIGDGGKFVRADLTQNMDAIAAKTLEDRRMRMVIKTGARLLAKGQLTEQAYQNFGPLGGIAANVYSAVTETADTRSWSLLPSRFYVTRLRLPAGTHKLKIRSNGKVTRALDVTIAAQQMTFLRDR